MLTDSVCAPRQFKSGRLPPGPSGYPLLGVIPKIGGDLLGFFLKTAIEFGGITHLQLGPQHSYLITKPEYVKQVLLDNSKNYAKGYDQVKPLFGNGLLTSDGDTWFRQRRLMQPAFHYQQLTSFATTMVNATASLLDAWRPLANTGQVTDVAAQMMGLTQRIILKTMFSIDAASGLDTITRAFDIALNHFNMAMFSPLSQMTWLPTAANRRYHWALRTLDAEVYRMIAVRRASGQDKDDLLSMLMNARDADSGEGMSDRQIRDEMMTIFLAGHETTATTLSWAWYLLAQHPEVEEKLVQEISTVLAGRTAAMADLPKLTYTRMVIDEVMRLYPPAWMFARSPINADVIGNYDLPAGATVMISPYVTHRLPSLWVEPDRFDPERHTPERTAARHRFAFLPFSNGPRVCIGNNFAIMETQIILTMLLQSYRLRLAPGHTVQPQARATLRPYPGVYMTIQ